MEKRRKMKPLELQEVQKTLNEKQILFCLLYAQDKNCFANASMSYTHAYNLTPKQALKISREAGYRLLTNVHIKQYINKLLLKKFNNTAVDARHAELMMQNKNLIVAMQAVQEYNKVKKRVDEAPIGKIEFSWKGDRRPQIKVEKAKEKELKPQITNRTPKGKFRIET